MTMTLRLGTPDDPRGVAHLAEFCGSHARWRARCGRIDVSEPDNNAAERQWRERDSYRGAGRLVLLQWDVPTDVPVCVPCIKRVRWDHEVLARWLAERGVEL